MEKLNKLTNTLNKIKFLSNKIIEKAIPIMQELEEDNNYILESFVDDLIESNPELGKNNPSLLLEYLQSTMIELLTDAEIIIKEIESFSDAVIQGDDAIDEGEDDFPFLLQVWRGDIYEKQNIKGLKDLEKDLKKQLKNLDEEKIISLTLERVLN